MSKKLYEISINEMHKICYRNCSEHKCGKDCPLSFKQGNDYDCYYGLHQELDDIITKKYEIEQFLLNHQNDNIEVEENE